VRGALVRVLLLGALVTVGLGVALVVSPGAREITVGVYLYVVVALALVGLVARVATALPRGEAARPRPQRPAQPLAQLESISRTLTVAESSAFVLHERLRPLVCEIAAARLGRRGVVLDREPARARALLGERAWELVRPDREPPSERYERGWSKADLRALVEALEAV
jgi:hypothetical protein